MTAIVCIACLMAVVASFRGLLPRAEKHRYVPEVAFGNKNCRMSGWGARR